MARHTDDVFEEEFLASLYDYFNTWDYGDSLLGYGDSLLDSRATRPWAKPQMEPDPARQPQVLWRLRKLSP